MTANAGKSGSSPANTLADRLADLSVTRGIIRQMAIEGQLVELRCEMPICYRGKRHAFDKKIHPPGPWAPSTDHYTRLQAHGGHLERGNVRLAHVLCNQRDAAWRLMIGRLLNQGMTLDQIAQRLTRRKVAPPRGQTSWSAKLVRRAYVSWMPTG
jgi:hypothetical protein